MISAPDDTKLGTALRNFPGDPRQARLILTMLLIALAFLYNRVKYIGENKVDVHTTCVVGSKFA